jgi:hypothetical protein
MQLRYLQTLTTIAADKNSTIVFPLPIDLPGALLERLGEAGGVRQPIASACATGSRHFICRMA